MESGGACQTSDDAGLVWQATSHVGGTTVDLKILHCFRPETPSVCTCAYQKAVSARLSRKIEVSKRSVKLLERLQEYASLR